MKYHTFLPQFHPLIQSGSKTTTIRGSTRVREGERFALRHWTGRPYGSPMGWLGTATCICILHVQLRADCYSVSHDGFAWLASDFPHEMADFARRDGFPTWKALVEHFGKRLPFTGVRISWRNFTPGAP